MDYYDSEDSDSQNDSHMDMEGESDNTPEEKQGLVPLSFFNRDVKPGDKETVEITSIKDGEAVIKCVYGEGKDDQDEESAEGEGMSDQSASSEAEDSMMT